VFRRSLILIVTAGVALALAASVAAALVRVRVEGKTQTVFGAAQPRAEAANPLAALEAASLGGEFYYHVQATPFGPYVDQIGRYPAAGSGGWVFKVNGMSPPVGADKLDLKDGDVVLWYWATFSASGGPPTLELSRRGNGCYRAVAKDDAGKAVAAAPVLKVDGRSVAMRGGTACPGPHRGLVRAVAPGAVRSNALT
jgi:hypothetical protein